MTTTYHFSSEELIRSCPLPKSFYSHQSGTHKSLTIEATKIEPLSSFLKNTNTKKHIEYSDAERLIEMIGRQLYHLEVEQNKGISMFHLDDITVFHSSSPSSSPSSSSIDRPTLAYFAITNEDNIYDIDDDNLMEMTIPPLPLSSSHSHHTHSHISKNIAFYSPEYKEFMSKKTIPYQLHFKSSYYSFGLLCVYCYVNRDITRTDHTISSGNSKEIETLFAPIINTKIYWFLKHVLYENPSERRYICV